MAKLKAEVAEEVKAPAVIDRAGLQDCVNQIKLEQAINAVTGRGKFDSKDIQLLAEGRSQGLSGNDLVKHIYVGRAGLVSAEKAAKNREIEVKLKRAR